MIVVFVFILMSSALWRLGGGAFTTLTGLSYGTDPARLMRALPATAFLLFSPIFSPNLCLPPLAVLALFIGVCFEGAGPFQGMGLPAPSAPEASWKRWLPLALGLKIGTVAHDFVGMMQCGVACMAPLALLVLCMRASGAHLVWCAAALLLAGVGFAPAYLLARVIPWSIPRFAAGQEWGEVFTGAIVGAAILGSVAL